MSPTSYQTAPPRGVRHGGACRRNFSLVEGAGFEPAKAAPTDLQSAPFDRFGTPPPLQANHGRLPPQRPTPGTESDYNIALLLLSSTAAVFPDVWSQRRGSNPQPTAYKAAALPLSYTGMCSRRPRQPMKYTDPRTCQVLVKPTR